MIEFFKAIFLGIIEGITEFLPISSTGHLYLADYFIKLQQPKAFVDMFMVVIQLGAILSVIVIYFNKLNPFSPKKTQVEKKDTWNLWFKVVVATIPAVIVGLPLNDFMEKYLTNWQVIATTLIVYGILFIVLEKINETKKFTLTNLNDMTYKFALMVGMIQILAIVPGTSRSGATILGAMLLGASRYVSTEFSFFLAIPTMFGASLLKLLMFFKHGNSFTGIQLPLLLVGMFVSFIVAYLAIKFLLNYIKTHDFTAFGWYRIILGVVVILIGFLF